MQHFGVYGLWRHEGHLVLVHKTRGPYTGLLDLPGGSPEADETREQTLARELREETGVDLAGIGPLRPFDICVSTDSAGNDIDFHHQGLIAEGQVTDALRTDITAEDVHGVALEGADTVDQMSPLVLEALRLFPAYALPAGDHR